MTKDARVLLYVEDDPDYADLVLLTFSKHRLPGTIHHVSDGEAALDYLARSGSAAAPRPKMILLDLRLPKVDGFEVLKVVKTTPALSGIPVVVLTTSSNETDVARTYGHHVNSYLVKPDEYATLDDMLKEIAHYWLVSNLVPTGH